MSPLVAEFLTKYQLPVLFSSPLSTLLSAALFYPRPFLSLSLSIFLPSFHFGEKGLSTLLLRTRGPIESASPLPLLRPLQGCKRARNLLSFVLTNWTDLSLSLSLSLSRREIAQTFRNRKWTARWKSASTRVLHTLGKFPEGKKLFPRSMDRNVE